MSTSNTVKKGYFIRCKFENPFPVDWGVKNLFTIDYSPDFFYSVENVQRNNDIVDVDFAEICVNWRNVPIVQ